jgi:hypothetical protein
MEETTSSAILFTPLPLPRDGFFMEIRVPTEGSSSLSFVDVRPFKPEGKRNWQIDKGALVSYCWTKIQKFSTLGNGYKSNPRHKRERVLLGNVSDERHIHPTGHDEWSDVGRVWTEQDAYVGTRYGQPNSG